MEEAKAVAKYIRIAPRKLRIERSIRNPQVHP